VKLLLDENISQRLVVLLLANLEWIERFWADPVEGLLVLSF
jgi:hypothetical protein